MHAGSRMVTGSYGTPKTVQMVKQRVNRLSQAFLIEAVRKSGEVELFRAGKVMRNTNPSSDSRCRQIIFRGASFDLPMTGVFLRAAVGRTGVRSSAHP